MTTETTKPKRACPHCRQLVAYGDHRNDRCPYCDEAIYWAISVWPKKDTGHWNKGVTTPCGGQSRKERRAMNTWIRRDRETGEEEPISAEQVERKLTGYYRDLPATMAAATRDMPLTTGAADYYPQEAE